MAAVAAGGVRHDLHARLRQHSQDAAAEVKQQGQANDLLDRLAQDEAIAGIDLSALMDPMQFVGRSPEQVQDFVAEVIQPIREKYLEDELDADVNV